MSDEQDTIPHDVGVFVDYEPPSLKLCFVCPACDHDYVEWTPPYPYDPDRLAGLVPVECPECAAHLKLSIEKAEDADTAGDGRE